MLIFSQAGPRRTRADGLCRFLYEILLVITAAVLVVVMLQSLGMRYARVVESGTPGLAVIEKGFRGDLRAGQEVSIYRFHEGWKRALGRAEVVGETPHGWQLRYTPEAFRWPMGRHAEVLEVQGDWLRIGVPGRGGFRVDERVYVFDGYRLLTSAVVLRVFPDHVWALCQPLSGKARPGDLVSEFSVPTQAVFTNGPRYLQLSLVILILVPTAYLLLWYFKRRSPMELLGAALRPALSGIWARASFRILAHLLIGLPVVWYLGRFAVMLAAHLVGLLKGLPGLSFLSLLGSSGWYATFETHEWWIYGVLYGLYAAILFWRSSPPLVLLWNAVRYRASFRGGLPEPWRSVLMWFLQLVVAYAFAYSLFSFLRGNLNAMLTLAWPGSGVSVDGQLVLTDISLAITYLGSFIRSVLYMFTHLPVVDSPEGFFALARYFVWSITILGCLVGYGHSVLGFLWGKKLHGLDFTPMGWLVNAVCYGPLLGAVVWAVVPSYVGPRPILLDGPLYYAVLAAELALNIAYMLSIWNLGTLFGVMTDKGVRTSGFYSVVRHPSYTLEALMFILMEVKGFSGVIQILSGSLIVLLYYVRSEREDQFLGVSNPDYLEYRLKTPYKFLPGIY